MRKFSIIGLVLFSILQAAALAQPGSTIEEVGKLLQTTGAEGRLHGVAGEYEEYVFSYGPNVFRQTEFSVLPENQTVRDTLKKLKRHDLVRLKGKYAGNPSPQKHIIVSEVEVLEEFQPVPSLPKFEHATKLPEDLRGKTEITGVVHAVASEGKILVMEYGDAVVPVFCRDNKLTRVLFRGDKVRIQVVLLPLPELPAHLLLNTKAATPLEFIDSVVQVAGQPLTLKGKLVDIHDRPLTLEGKLVLFPMSPQITVDVFAMQVEDSQGAKRNFTLMSEDTEVFFAIRKKLHEIWDPHSASAKNGRNFLIHPEIKIRVKGRGNMVSPRQANPQLVLEQVGAIEVIATPH